MITLPRTIRVWAYGRPTDLRKGYNGLVGLVKQELREDPLSGDLFLFVSRRRTGCKVLLWDGTGLCIFMKKLERGRFAELWGGWQRQDGSVAGIPAAGEPLPCRGPGGHGAMDRAHRGRSPPRPGAAASPG